MSRPRGKITYSLYMICVLPLLFFAITIIFAAYHSFTHAMELEVRVELENSAKALIQLYDVAYPGDYRLVASGEAISIYKGEHNLTGDYALIDSFSEKMGTEFSLFYEDTRVLTTLRDKKDVRIVGTGANITVIREVLEIGVPRFYNMTLLNQVAHFSYYMPLRNSDGTIVGMVFAGKPSQEVRNNIFSSLWPLILMGLAGTCAAVLVSFFYARRLADVLLQIKDFLSKVSTGTLDARLDPLVLGRRDELGEIGSSAMHMQRSLKTLIEQDSLTGLLNRRTMDKYLIQAHDTFKATGSPFVLAIADIDFFKNINDTYGHACGDMVLQKISHLLREHMVGKGYVARWGGEEFLLLWTDSSPQDAKASLLGLLEAVGSLSLTYEGTPVPLSVTIGAAGSGDMDIDTILKLADSRLYEGKTSGRNKLVWEEASQ